MVVELPREARDDVIKLQQVQQQLQLLMLQKQNIQLQAGEVENALKEIDKSPEKTMFEIVGTIMIKKERQDLLSSLSEKKEILELRLRTLDKQINNLTKKAQELQDKIMKYIREKAKPGKK
jgi:prefoldin beta subunit